MLPGFSVKRVLLVPGTIFFHFQTPGGVLLVLPGAVPVFNVILLINFFKGVPESLDEAARIDGAGPLTVLLKVYLPISLPALATVGLFAIVNHWNDYFSGLIYMSKASMYPLQS